MTAGELLNHLRLKMVSMGEVPPIDEVLLTYLNNAYVGFVSSLDGVPDTEELDVDAGEYEITLPSYLLKIKSAQRADGKYIDIFNPADLRNNNLNAQLGVSGDEIKILVIGDTMDVARVAYTPTTNTTIRLEIDRLPKKNLTTESSKVTDIGDIWQLSLVDGAAAVLLAMSGNMTLRNEAPRHETRYANAIADARRKKAREKSKITRSVRYGGI